MKRVWYDYIIDIRTALQEVETFTQGMIYKDFLEDQKTINAVVRSLEVMGEAAKNVPEEVRKQFPSVPWKRMAGMRDKLIHEYSGVDLEIVWTAVRVDAPPLKLIMDKMLQGLERASP